MIYFRYCCSFFCRSLYSYLVISHLFLFHHISYFSLSLSLLSLSLSISLSLFCFHCLYLARKCPSNNTRIYILTQSFDDIYMSLFRFSLLPSNRSNRSLRACAHTHTHTHTQSFPFSAITRISNYVLFQFFVFSLILLRLGN